MSETIKALAEAVREIGKPLVETGCGLIQALLGKPCEIAGEMISDQLYRWQWERRIEIAEKADSKIKARGLTAKVLPTGFFLNFLNNAGDIESPELQRLWANLLTSAVETEANQHPGFIHVLKQLSVMEARLLASVGDEAFRYFKTTEKRYPPRHLRSESTETTQNIESKERLEICGIDKGDVDATAVLVGLSHLSELGVINVQVKTDYNGRTEDGIYISTIIESWEVSFTAFGASFFSACISDESRNPANIIDQWSLLHDIREIAEEAVGTAEEAGKEATKAKDEIKTMSAGLRYG